MKRIVTIALLFSSLLVFAQTSKKRRVLYIGNSYTYVNNLPQLVHDIALAGGDTLVFDSSCPGGYTFYNHFNDATTLAKIATGNWDYVVLQAQSQEPSFPPTQVSTQTLPYAIKLDSVVKKYNPCATTVFYETWGRKNGDASNCPNYPPLCTYAGMQNRLKQSYKLFADTTGAVLCPAGEAFRSSITASPTINLYQADESHPSPEGSYLAGSVFYELLFQRSVLSNTYNPGIATGTLAFLQQTAHATFRDSLATWNVGKKMPWADYTSLNGGAGTFTFAPVATGFSHKWYFGNGTTSSLIVPVYSYTASGNYVVSHVNFNSCKRDSVSQVVAVSLAPVSISAYVTAGEMRIYPNPFNSRITIDLETFSEPEKVNVRISDAMGREVYSGSYRETLDLGELPEGVYFLTATTISQSCRAKLLKVSGR